jgi:hypothetical protein
MIKFKFTETSGFYVLSFKGLDVWLKLNGDFKCVELFESEVDIDDCEYCDDWGIMVDGEFYTILRLANEALKQFDLFIEEYRQEQADEDDHIKVESMQSKYI